MLCSSAVSFASWASLYTSIVYVVTFCWPSTWLVSVRYRYFAHSSAKLPRLATAPGVTVVTVFVPVMLWPWMQLSVACIAWLERHELNAVSVCPESCVQPVAFIVWFVTGVSVAFTCQWARTAVAPVPPEQLACCSWFTNLLPTAHDVPPLHAALVETRFEPAGITIAFLHCVAFSQVASVASVKGPTLPLLAGAPDEETPTQ